MKAPKTQIKAPDTREVADLEETERPDRPADRDDPDERARAHEHAHTWRPTGSMGWLGPDE